MATQVELKFVEVKDDVKTSRTERHDIERVKGTQIIRVISIARQVITTLSNDDNLQDFLDQTFGGDFKFDPDAPADLNKQIDAKLVMKLVGSIDVLMEFVPNKAFELISVMSGIERDALEKQDAFDILDIYDAILVENDIEKLYTRIKKSLETTMKALKFLNKTRQATQAE